MTTDTLFSPSAGLQSGQAPAAHDRPPLKPPTPQSGLARMGLLGTAAAALSACGGGSDADPSTGPGPGPGPGQDPAFPSTSAGPRPASVVEGARFLAQATPGYSAADLDALMRLPSYEAWLQAQFALPRSRSHCDWMVDNGYDDPAHANATRGLDNSIWRKLIASPDALRQRVTLALSEICVVSVLGVTSAWRQFSVGSYLDILEAYAFGNYRELLQHISLSPAMGSYLTFRGNAKGNPKTGSEPDENYARELMQLFTIGLVELNADGSVRLSAGQPVETYTQADVSGLARVFTGWDLDKSGYGSPYPPAVHRRPMVQVASRHEPGSKTFLGVTVPAGASGEAALSTALDTLFGHPNLPPFVARQMIQRLVTSNPSPAYVARAAAAFANNGRGVRGDMQALLRAILLDPEARSPAQAAAPGFGKLREPVVRLLNWARAFGVRSTSGVWGIGDLSSPSSGLGQSPMRSPSVFNFFRPGYVPPDTALSARGLCGPEFQITTEVSVAGYVNYMQRVIGNSFTGDLLADYGSLAPLAGDAAALASQVNLLLAAGALPAATLARIQAAIDSIPAAAKDATRNRISIALLLVLASPEYIAQK